MTEEPIKIREITETSVELYNKNNELIGTVTSELIFNDIRIQIKELKLSDYYIVFEGKRINIDHEGGLEDWPKGLFDTHSDQLFNLLSI